MCARPQMLQQASWLSSCLPTVRRQGFAILLTQLSTKRQMDGLQIRCVVHRRSGATSEWNSARSKAAFYTSHLPPMESNTELDGRAVRREKIRGCQWRGHGVI